MAKRFRDAVDALEHILATIEKAPERTVVRIHPDYEGMRTGEELERFQHVMRAAEEAGAVRIVLEQRPSGPASIRYVTLADATKLAAHLGRVPATNEAAQAIDALRRFTGPLPAWVDEIVDEIAVAWAIRREGYPGLVPGDVAAAANFVRLLCAVDRGEHVGVDMRTFSRRACSDSKAAERGLPRLARALRKRFDLPDAPPREALAAFGIEKFPQPVLLRGSLRLFGGTRLDGRPYIGVPPEWLDTLAVDGQPEYFLVIENLASFNRYVRELDDAGIILYSGGFPALATLRAIRRMDALLPADVPFFHWGDVDADGVRILQHIARSIRRPLRPHLMGVDAWNDKAVDELRLHLAAPSFVPMEQEQLDPQSPLAGTPAKWQ
jgi:hypothetical protein